MLDIRFIRENADLVQKQSEQKGYPVDIQSLLQKYETRNTYLRERENLKQKINEISSAGSRPSEERIVDARKLKEQHEVINDNFRKADDEYIRLLKGVPNMPLDSVPEGTSEADNKVDHEWGEKPHFDFQAKTHWELGESSRLIDKERASKVSGSRFAYIKGGLVHLQMAILQFGLSVLTSEDSIKKIIQEFNLEVASKPFMPILPPAMVRTDVYDNMDRLEPREERYKIDGEELWLQGSAEHTLGPMYTKEILSANELPIRIVGYLTSFRREAGSYGKDIEGIIRMHQFDKLEMESFSLPEQGLEEHKLMIAIQEYLMRQLKLPYRVLNKCKADIGKPNASGWDLDVWLPGHNRHLETHTADFMTDYQSRRLKTRAKKPDGDMVFVHTNDETAFAMGRTMIGIMENYQTEEGKIVVPEVLRPYMNNQTTL